MDMAGTCHSWDRNNKMNTGSQRCEINKQVSPKQASNSIMTIIGNGHGLRRDLEDFILQAYKQKFCAELKSFLPQIAASISPGLRFNSVFGYGAAASGQLFLEQYIDDPIEAVISAHHGARVERAKIVEVGNLVCASHAQVAFELRKIANYLGRQGFEWIVCTATRQLRLVFLRAGARPITLAPARVEKISGNTTDWGSYYSNSPQILVGISAKALP